MNATGKKKQKQPTPPGMAAPPVKRRGCLFYAGWGVALLLGLFGCAVIANLAGGDRPAAETPERSAGVTLPTDERTALPTWTNTPEAATVTPAPPTATAAPSTATPAPPTTTLAPAAATATNTLEVATATPAPPTATTVPPAIIGAVASDNANLRSGPGTDYAVIGGAVAGDQLAPVGRNEAGDWLQLASGAWIATALVLNAPGDLPVTAAAALVATAEPVAPVAEPAEAQPNAFTCTGGCATPPDPSCAIKGNVNSGGELIYHMPGWRDYERTTIKLEEGDRWFCTAEEAVAAGFRAPQNY